MPHQIYFCGSIRGHPANLKKYQAIVDYLKTKGPVLTEHVAYPQIEQAKNQTDQDIFDQDWGFFQKSTIMIAEVSQPSHGVGIELGWAMTRKDYPVLCLHDQESQFRLSGLIGGCKTFTCKSYKENEFESILEAFFRDHS